MTSATAMKGKIDTEQTIGMTALTPFCMTPARAQLSTDRRRTSPKPCGCWGVQFCDASWSASTLIIRSSWMPKVRALSTSKAFTASGSCSTRDAGGSRPRSVVSSQLAVGPAWPPSGAPRASPAAAPRHAPSAAAAVPSAGSLGCTGSRLDPSTIACHELGRRLAQNGVPTTSPPHHGPHLRS